MFGMLTARAASMARCVSSSATSRWPEIATMPREFWELTWLPLTPTSADRTLYPDMRSAASMAAVTPCTVRSMSMTTPLRSPSDGALPIPMTFAPPRSSSSPMSAHTFVVPMSIATITGCSGMA